MLCFSTNVGVTIGFVNTTYSVSESDGIAVVSVAVLSGELSDDVVVRLTTRGGSATRTFVTYYILHIGAMIMP